MAEIHLLCRQNSSSFTVPKAVREFGKHHMARIQYKSKYGSVSCGGVLLPAGCLITPSLGLMHLECWGRCTVVYEVGDERIITGAGVEVGLNAEYIAVLRPDYMPEVPKLRFAHDEPFGEEILWFIDHDTRSITPFSFQSLSRIETPALSQVSLKILTAMGGAVCDDRGVLRSLAFMREPGDLFLHSLPVAEFFSKSLVVSQES